MPLEHGRDAARGSRGSDGVDEGVDLPLRLTPDLFPERTVAGDAVPVVELIRPVRVRLLAQPASGFDHVQDQLLRGEASLAADERELGAERSHLIQLLRAERIGADDLQTVASGGADQRERRPRAAARVFDDGVSGLQPSVLLGTRDHEIRHPVLEAAGRVLPLELHEDVGTTGWYDPS